MGHIAKQMKNLSEDILASYNNRLASYKNRLLENEELVKDVQNKLDGFRKDQMELAAAFKSNAAKLHENLAEGQKERLKSFQDMMNGIHGSINQIQEEVKYIKVATGEMLSGISAKHKEMADTLHEELDLNTANRSKWNVDRVKNFDLHMNGIQAEVLEIFTGTHNLMKSTQDFLKKTSKNRTAMSKALRDELQANLEELVNNTKDMLLKIQRRISEISDENQKMAKDLHKSLDDNDAKRLKEFNASMARTRKSIHDIEQFVSKFLGEFNADRKMAAVTWEKMTAAIAEIKKSFNSPQVAKPSAAAAQKTNLKMKSRIIAAEKDFASN